MSSSATYLDPVVIPLIKGETVLDVGCGWGRWGSLLSTNYWEANLKKAPIIDGIDVFSENVERCKKLFYYNNVEQKQIPCKLNQKWDTILACEIIEHIPQKKVFETIELLENSAKKRIIFSTPNWPYIRDQGGSNNPYEAHLSYIPKEEFIKRGYKILGAGFGNPDSRIVMKLLKYFGPKLKQNLQSLSRIFTSWGIAIVAYKDI